MVWVPKYQIKIGSGKRYAKEALLAEKRFDASLSKWNSLWHRRNWEKFSTFEIFVLYDQTSVNAWGYTTYVWCTALTLLLKLEKTRKMATSSTEQGASVTKRGTNVHKHVLMCPVGFCDRNYHLQDINLEINRPEISVEYFFKRKYTCIRTFELAPCWFFFLNSICHKMCLLSLLGLTKVATSQVNYQLDKKLIV